VVETISAAGDVGNMPNAPLRYALAVMKFPKILSIEKVAGAFQELLDPQYPVMTESKNEGFEATIAPDKTPEFKLISEKLWQFACIDKSHAIILSGDYLLIHAGPAYVSHSHFFGRFHSVVESFTKVRGPGSVFSALGFRYIDIVKPAPSEALSSYLAPWVLPNVELLPAEGLDLVDAVYIAGFRTNLGLMRFQAFHNPAGTLPPDLNSSFVHSNGWVAERPEGAFALLDIDHAAALSREMPIDPDVVIDTLTKLWAPARSVFDKAVTSHAKSVWGKS